MSSREQRRASADSDENICLRLRNSYEILDEESRRARVDALLRRRHGISLLDGPGVRTLTSLAFPTDLQLIPASTKEIERTLRGRAEVFLVSNDREKSLWVSLQRYNHLSFEERAFYGLLLLLVLHFAPASLLLPPPPPR